MRRFVSRWTFALLGIVLLCFPGAARAQLWGLATGDDALFYINVNTGNATFYGFTVLPETDTFILQSDFVGLEMLNGSLYGINIFDPNSGDAGLFKLNVPGTPTGFVTCNLVTTLTGDLSDSFYGLAGDPTTNTLYAVAETFGDADLYRFAGANSFTPEFVATVDPAIPYADGLAFQDGLLWGLDDITSELYTIDPTNGLRSTVGILDVTAASGDNTFSSSFLGFYSGLAWRENRLWMVTSDDNDLSALFEVDPTNANLRFVNYVTASGDGLTISGLAAAVSPEPATGLLILPIVGLALARRRSPRK